MGFWSLRGAFWQKLYKTKVAGHPQLSGARSPYRTQNPDLEPCHSLSSGVYNTKVAGHPQLSGVRSPYRTPDLEGPGAVVTHFQGEFIK